MTASTPTEPGPRDESSPREDPALAADASKPRSPDRLHQPGQVPQTFVAIRIGLSIVLILALSVSAVLLLQAGVVGAIRDVVTGYLDWLPLVG